LEYVSQVVEVGEGAEAADERAGFGHPFAGARRNQRRVVVASEQRRSCRREAAGTGDTGGGLAEASIGTGLGAVRANFAAAGVVNVPALNRGAAVAEADRAAAVVAGR
jgi:hypothetical protein